MANRTMTNRQIHLVALRTASEAHRRLGIDTSQQIDPFAAIERAGVTVGIVPLASLSGAYMPGMPETDGQPGILINVKHPRTRQRFTAAHELCHHLRDGGAVVLDAETEFLPRDTAVKDDREAIAEAFAGWFLMPKRLVTQLISQLDIALPAPDEVYRLSLGLGTSYLATAAHLYSLGFINRATWKQLAKLPPKWIKQQVAVHGPGDAWGDVWHVASAGDGEQLLTPRPGDEIVVDLDESPSTGYVWNASVGKGYEIVESSFEQDVPNGDDLVVGGRGRRRLVLRTVEPGEHRLDLQLQRPWQRSQPPLKRFALRLTVEEPRSGYRPLAAAV